MRSDVLAAAVGTNGVFRFRGHMVDSPVLRHAEHTLRRAGHLREVALAGVPPSQRASSERAIRSAG